MRFQKAISVVQRGALPVIDKVKKYSKKVLFIWFVKGNNCGIGRLLKPYVLTLETLLGVKSLNLSFLFFKFPREIMDLSKTCLFSDDGPWFRIGLQQKPLVIFQLRFVKKWPGTVFSYFSSSYSFIFLFILKYGFIY